MGSFLCRLFACMFHRCFSFLKYCLNYSKPNFKCKQKTFMCVSGKTTFSRPLSSLHRFLVFGFTYFLGNPKAHSRRSPLVSGSLLKKPPLLIFFFTGEPLR